MHQEGMNIHASLNGIRPLTMLISRPTLIENTNETVLILLQAHTNSRCS